MVATILLETSSDSSECSASQTLSNGNTEKCSQSGFEGPEKLVEIWFKKKSTNGPPHTLRNVSRDVWEQMLQIVQCQILSVITNDYADAYLLSESSMFVYSNRLILKTCGTTTLLHSVPQILKIAHDAGMGTVEAFFYSRKSFLYPDRQEWPHGKWDEEVNYLDDIFKPDSFETSGYVLGKVNGDHWCLYVCTPGSLDSNGLYVEETLDDQVADIQEDGLSEEDMTLEILMTDLDQESMKRFWRTELEKKQASKCTTAKHNFSEKRVFTSTGISEIYPGSKIDDYVFDPCGYSLNGLLDEHYYTIHVTPESICSYASFETTVPVKHFSSNPDRFSYESFENIIERVIGVFKPGKFSTTIFVRSKDIHTPLLHGRAKGFRMRDSVVQNFGKWKLYFTHYDKWQEFRQA